VLGGRSREGSNESFAPRRWDLQQQSVSFFWFLEEHIRAASDDLFPLCRRVCFPVYGRGSTPHDARDESLIVASLSLRGLAAD
jgi:hypothetical protein